jgi:hypothetical protein
MTHWTLFVRKALIPLQADTRLHGRFANPNTWHLSVLLLAKFRKGGWRSIPKGRDSREDWARRGYFCGRDFKRSRSVQTSPSLGSTPSAEKVKNSHSTLMASSSKPGPSLEERLGEMQMELIKLKAVVREQARSMLNNDFVGEQRYDLLVQDLKNLREDLTSDSDAQFKDVANVHGDFGKRLSKLEAKIDKLSEEWAKKKTTQVKENEEGKSN